MERGRIRIDMYILGVARCRDGGVLKLNLVTGRLGGLKGVRKNAGAVEDEISASEA
jgi:hypothetical protein